ncbi:calcium-binding protein [Neogemmobacter tilapiae]|uniref:Calcium-binding protein n=1 Tax=Neogemmobacter tilapiae TaxID=875041 RepID=A0A918TK43_9RHOB|nr:hypothetical protein [Gemmobacter tilapiae]GHC49336.1 hypothetical protein GCM10007315_09350 [Gemmobacter tilapiae]
MSITTTRDTALLQTLPSFASIPGTAGPDTLTGGASPDTINGKGGNDLLYGKGGADVLVGGAGDDFLFGGKGNDQLDGGVGDDVLSGGAGADDFMFRANQGEDTIDAFQDNIDEIRFVAQGGDTVKFLISYNTSTDVATVRIRVNGSITNTLYVESVEVNDLQQSQQGNTLILS